MDLATAPKRNPPIEIWWENAYKVCIRQDNGSTADVITLTLGQTYDLMTAFARALDCGPAD